MAKGGGRAMDWITMVGGGRATGKLAHVAGIGRRH
jgi:hypothetical protein